jgi:hypothetical protein
MRQYTGGCDLDTKTKSIAFIATGGWYKIYTP